MKLLSTFFLSLFLTSSLIGQYSFDPEVILLESDGADIDIDIQITNNTGEFANIYWMYERGENYPQGWRTIICDDTLCYAPDKFKSSPNLPNPMQPDYSFKFNIKVLADDVAGSSYGILHIYDDGNCENEVATTSPPSVSVEETELEKLFVYPNPTQDVFTIKNDENVESIDVLNSTGKILIRAEHEQNKMHSIEHLSNGIYVVVLKDDEDNILKSLYLYKE